MRWFKVKLRLAFNEQVTFAASAFKPIRTSSRKHFITPQSSSLVKSFSGILPQSFPLTHRKFKVLCHKILFANRIITRVIKLEHMSWIMHCKIKLETKQKLCFTAQNGLNYLSGSLDGKNLTLSEIKIKLLFSF